MYSTPVHPQDATNRGQTRADFRVVIAGSNGYALTTLSDASLPGWKAQYLADAAIRSSKDCNGDETNLRYRAYPLPYDPNRCLEACSAQSDYNLRHPPADGSEVRLCNYFNSYILNKNGVAQEQGCALYTRAWPGVYGTNKGQPRGQDVITITESYGYENGSIPSTVCLP